MKRIVDLELWSLPQAVTIPLDGKGVADACRTATGLPDDVVLGLNFIPSDTDIDNLNSALAGSVPLAEHFAAFCQGRGLPRERGHAKSAAEFLAFLEGQPLAWLHFPFTDEGREMAVRVYDWAERCGYAVRIGQGAPELSKADILAFWQD